MAVLFISEFGYQGRDGNGATISAAVVPTVADQTLAVGAASAASVMFNGSTSMVRLVSDVICSVKFGSTPVASTVAMRLSPGAAEYFSVPSGQSYKVAVIANT